ncbi:MAG: PAS domain S-box protein [Bacteroidetes bacterium]|nr:PAS domain S-box protein [Bacteroidota bacterium]
MSDRQFTDEEFEVLQFLASYASLALRNIRLMGDLREHEEAQRTVLQTISDGVISIDRNGIVRYANVFAETMFGYRYGELIGKHFQILLPPMTGRTPRERLRAMLGGILYPSPWHALEMTGIRSDGERLSLEVSIGETKRNGQRLYTGIIRNITERKREEELLRATMSRLTSLIQTIQAGVLVEDETRHISLINQNFCDLFGIPVPSAQLLGTDCSMAAEQTKDLFADPEGFIRRIDGMLAERRVVVNDELALKDGRTFERDYIPIFSADQYKGHMWLYRDVTERKTAEQEATNAKRIAEESLRAKQDFLAKMSHELRTPMNSVIGLTNLMLNTQLGEDQTTLMQGIKTAGSNLLVIINDILDLAKIEAGKLTIDRSEIVLREMIDNIIVGLRPMARQKGLELNVSVDPSLPTAVLGDKVRLSQIIINLLSNAIKFTHEGSVTIACTAGIGPDVRRRLICTVSDTGIGIPLHKQENIFEAFAQASQDIAVRYGGTGLGLTIVRQLVSLMHGDIRVESTEGKGSSFIVTLPLEESLRQRAAGTAHRSIPQELKPLQGTVLLVEDNPANQLVAARSLSLWSVDTDVAPDGMTALSMLVQKQYDLVLMDIQMPGIDGFETTRRIREEMPEPFRSVPIVAMTASVLYDPEARASAAGMNGYVSKPFELEDLHAVLIRFLPVRTVPDEGPEAASVRSESGMRYLDTTFLEGIAGNNRSFVREMLTLFARNTPQYLESIRTALEARDFPAVKYTAHTLKPTGAYIGISELKALAAALEVSAESGDADGSAAANFARLESLCLDVLKDVEEWIRQEDRKGGAA